jgi:hypothetical protein
VSIRPHFAADPATAPRPSARVARVAELLDCDAGDVRRLIRSGELETHGKGKRGVRVFLDSVRDYQDRQTKPMPDRADAVIHRPKARSAASTAAHRAAMAGLAAKGLV